MARETFLTVSYDEYTDRYRADMYVNNVYTEGKFLTAHEAEGLSVYLNIIDDGKDHFDIPLQELIDQIDDGDILLDDESNLLQLLQRTHNALSVS